MRTFLAFIIGVVLTIGFAFIHDTVITPPAKPFVNWDAVQDGARDVVDFGRTQWDRLVK